MTEHKHVFIEAGGLTYCDCGASPYTLSSKPSNDHFADKFPTADELAMLREAYAETYPVRPLLNEIERLREALEKIAATTWAWEGIEIAREALKLP